MSRGTVLQKSFAYTLSFSKEFSNQPKNQERQFDICRVAESVQKQIIRIDSLETILRLLVHYASFKNARFLAFLSESVNVFGVVAISLRALFIRQITAR
jgi:hypothetical protein